MDPGLRRIVLARLEADGSLGDGWGALVLGALGGRDGLEAQLAGSAASAPRPLAAQVSPAPTGAFLRSVAVEGFRGTAARRPWSWRRTGLTLVVGAVLGLEVSRLARSCVDWYRLLEVAALAGNP